jgi:hypothetical protein
VAAFAALSLLINPTAPLIAAGRTQAASAAQPAAAKTPPPAAKSQPAAAKTPAAAKAPSADVDGGWPRYYSLPSGASILVYQPQISSWDKQKHMVAFSAVSYRTASAEKPALGTIKIEADTQVALTERLVNFQKMQIAEANFQTLSKDQVREITAQVEKTMPPEDRVIALDRVLANVDKSGIVAKDTEGVKADPPPIFFSKTPAVMVNLDGDPIWSPIKENDLKFAVNTNWDLFQHGPSNTLYCATARPWLKAGRPQRTEDTAGSLPASFGKLPPDDNWKAVKAALPGKAIARVGGAEGVRQHEAGRIDPADR